MSAFKDLSKSSKLLKGGKVLSTIDDMRAAPVVVVMIPVDGAIVATATSRCEAAGTMFGSGFRRKEWATGQLRSYLRRRGFTEKNIDEIVSVGLLVATGRAVVLEEPRPAKGKAAVKEEPTDKPRGRHLASMPIGPAEGTRPEEESEGG